MRPYLNGPRQQPESHYAAILNIFMYMYASYCMPFKHFEYYSMSVFFKWSGFAPLSNIDIRFEIVGSSERYNSYVAVLRHSLIVATMYLLQVFKHYVCIEKCL